MPVVKRKPLYTKEYLEELVKDSLSVSEVLRKTGRQDGKTYKQLKRYLTKYDIDLSHFKPHSKNSWRKMADLSYERGTPLDMVLVENSSFSRNALKRKLYKEGLKTRICELCGQDEDWHGKHMGLILDHINGVNNDNRIENLRIVCPNCNATLDTHGGKNHKKKRDPKPPKGKRKSPTKIQWPDNDSLHTLMWSKPLKEIAEELGVSDTAVKKYCDKNGIERPPAFYWVRKDWLDD